MQKFITAMFSLVLILSLWACGSTEAPPAQTSLSGGIGGEITVSAYDAMTHKAFLEDAARLFQEKYPGVTVHVETFSAMPEIKTSGQGGMIMAEYQDDPQGRQDYISQVNTALMGGGGADILAMDVLPFYKYADSGQLEDLAAFMESDPQFDKAGYRGNILDAVQYKNGIWFMPLDYSFYYYTFDSALLPAGAAAGFGTDGKYTVKELAALAEPFFDGSALIFNRPDYAGGMRPDLWSLLLEENYTSFVDIENKTANFADGAFAALLESARQYGGQGSIAKDMSVKSFFFQPKENLSLISFFTRGLGMSMTGMAEGNIMAIGDHDEIAGIQACADGSVPFTCSQAYGINANSKNKETAWAFLKFLLSEQIQLSTRLPSTALPILNSAREKKMELMLAGVMRQDGQPLTEGQLEAAAKYNETVEKLSDRLDAYILRDAIVDDMIAAEARYFFEGAKTAAETAEALQNKVTFYLNE